MVVMGRRPFVVSQAAAPRRAAVGVSSSVAGLAGEGEEDLVEGGLAQGDVVDLDAGGVERARAPP